MQMATPVDATAPSATPITERITSRLSRPVAQPDKPDSSENRRIAGTRTLRRPKRSESPPITKADMPQNTPRMPTRLPRS